VRGRQAAHLVTLLAGLAAIAPAPAADSPRIAIIIDDLGYQRAAGRRAVGLPGPVACAVLPLTPRAAELAAAAHAAGKEVLLHLPLQSLGEELPQPGGIVLDMSREQLAQTFEGSLRSVPHVVGVNTHQGSLLTQHPGHMHWLMQEIAARDRLFFVDSYTTVDSVALQLAREAGIASLRRDVFLDSDRSPETVAREFARLKRLARDKGMAVGIGHPYPETLALLERELPRLADEGLELVGIGEYLRRSRQSAALRRRSLPARGGAKR
jgi:polysaccharide deacetylase 2 family uncharacterized protein YibQ